MAWMVAWNPWNFGIVLLVGEKETFKNSNANSVFRRRYITIYLRNYPVTFKMNTASGITLLSHLPWKQLRKPTLSITNSVSHLVRGPDIVISPSKIVFRSLLYPQFVQHEPRCIELYWRTKCYISLMNLYNSIIMH